MTNHHHQPLAPILSTNIFLRRINFDQNGGDVYFCVQLAVADCNSLLLNCVVQITKLIATKTVTLQYIPEHAA